MQRADVESSLVDAMYNTFEEQISSETLSATSSPLSVRSNTSGDVPMSTKWLTTQRMKSTDQNMIHDHHTKILASLVPDEIIYNIDDRSIREYESCLLLGDVSGFTDLTQKYNKSGKGGPSRLTEVLNNYIGAMVQEILKHEGDVLKFSGDAFIALWKVNEKNSVQDCVSKTLDCAVTIQKSFGKYQTDVGVSLGVKLAIAAGNSLFSIIGSEDLKHYIGAGKVVMDVKNAEHLCTAGDIMVHQTAWQYVNIHEYDYTPMPDGNHVRVLGMGQSWKTIQKAPYEEAEEEYSALREDDDYYPLVYSDRVPHPDAAPLLMTMSGEKINNKPAVKTNEFSLRPSINYAAEHKMKDVLRPFIIRPVMRGVDMDEPLEYLTEIRQVVIVFVNLITTQPGVQQMIALVDESYKMVCAEVDKAEGCVNKVSLFDKDLMFLIVFGLRGFKHDLESQIALRVAATLRTLLLSLQEVTNASVGVTTGMTYCGVVGHTMRREYTVIGVSVNKAARLMTNYPGRVTCDRETFLHSKMEACHFVLQEPKPLKGIPTPGPIYEFNEQNVTETLTHTVSKSPLLSREENLNVFRVLIAKMMERKKGIPLADHESSTRSTRGQEVIYSTLVIIGEPRQGKSRLLDEIVYSACQGIIVNRFSLTQRDITIPFSGIKLIFAPALGFLETSSPKEKEDKISEKLAPSKLPEYLCVVNDLFSVNFELTKAYLQLDAIQRSEILTKVLKILIRESFKVTWVIGIDDCEFLDEETWALFSTILEEDSVFMVMTLGNRHELCPNAKSVINHPNVYRMHLSGIDKWYQAGLACQILEVVAIPPELEKIIHSRSNGNPGWIESYLVSLIQFGCISIRAMTNSELDKMGLVTPPACMITRITDTKSESDSGSSGSEDEYDKEARDDSWKMYATSYQESYQAVTTIQAEKDKKKKNMKDPTATVAVCILSPAFVIDEVEADTNMDAIMLKLFDSLTSFEQLILKCSSVIGENFSRRMLTVLLAKPAPRELSIAVQKLFEIRILACANGDFTGQKSNIIVRKRSENPHSVRGIICECLGITIDEMCKDLPAYASCGYMSFRITQMRDTTYTLLTDNQKREFHGKAAKFLERETRRCQSCGGGHFARILGYRHDDLIRSSNQKKSIVKKRSSISDGTKDEESIFTSSVTYKANMSLLTTIHHEQMLLTKLRRGPSGDLPLQVPNRLLLDPHPVRRRICGLLPVPGVTSSGSSLSLTRSFSSVDFTSCQCPLILTTMYTQLLEHCRGAAMEDKVMEALLEYTAVCITLCNHPQAIKLLESAQLLVDNVKKKAKEKDTYTDKDGENDIPVWKIPYILGKIHTLQGYSRLELGQIEAAFDMLFVAMKELGYPFPVTRWSVKMAVRCQMVKQKFMLDIFPSLLIGRANGFEAIFADQLSECLALMCTLFKYTQQWEMAQLSAIWGLNKALESDMDFFGLCTAYSNMMDVAQHYGNVHISWSLENSALEICRRKIVAVESQELQAVARLYYAVFNSRLLRAEIERAITVGYKTLHIGATIHAVLLRLQILPAMIETLILRSRIADAVSLLNALQFSSAHDSDKSGRSWYFAMCLVIHLNTGYTVLPFKQCVQFYQEEGETLIAIRDPDSERRYFTSIWLWCIRNEMWEASDVWAPRARLDLECLPDDSLANIITALYLLEGLLIYIADKLKSRNVEDVSQAYTEIVLLMRRIKQASQVVKRVQPRYLVLKAYFAFIRNNDCNKAVKQLREAKELAQKQGNILIAKWAEHNEKVWRRNITPIARDYWRDHCRPNNLLNWHEADHGDKKYVMFSLPIPSFY